MDMVSERTHTALARACARLPLRSLLFSSISLLVRVMQIIWIDVFRSRNVEFEMPFFPHCCYSFAVLVILKFQWVFHVALTVRKASRWLMMPKRPKTKRMREPAHSHTRLMCNCLMNSSQNKMPRCKYSQFSINCLFWLFFSWVGHK